MDIQEMLSNAVAAKRQEELKNSPQMLLGELIAKLEGIKPKEKEDDEEKQVYFDFEYLHPTKPMSFRGIYSELALGFTSHDFPDRKSKPPTLTEFIGWLKEAVGKTYEGYKGGDFVMGKQTPIWVANYGNSGHTAVVGVIDSYNVILITQYLV